MHYPAMLRGRQPWYDEPMKRRLAICCTLAVMAWSCQTPRPATPALIPATDAPDVPTPLVAADAELREYLRVTQLGAVPADAQRREDVAAALIRWKTNRMVAATAPFDAALTRNATAEMEEFALLRLAVASLNMGCEVAGLEPGGATDAQRGILEDVLTRAAFKSIEHARELLDAAAALSGRRKALVDRLRDELPRDEGAVASACAATRAAWAAPDAATIDVVGRAGCDDEEGALCFVWATWGNGGADALTRACDADLGEACVRLADERVMLVAPQSDAATATTAEALYARACGLNHIEGCRKEVAVFVPARAEEYRAGCLERDDAVSCLKLARTLALRDHDRHLWWSCTTSEGRPAAAEAVTRCSEGDAFACVTRAGSLKVDPNYVIRVQLDAATDHAKATVNCSEGDLEACASGARAFARAGDWGCAAALMTEACGRGETELCGFAEVD